jgi:hypothetical protein
MNEERHEQKITKQTKIFMIFVCFVIFVRVSLKERIISNIFSVEEK